MGRLDKLVEEAGRSGISEEERKGVHVYKDEIKSKRNRSYGRVMAPQELYWTSRSRSAVSKK